MRLGSSGTRFVIGARAASGHPRHYRTRPPCWSATSAGAASTPSRWGSRPTASTGCFPTARTCCASRATSASAWSTACRHSTPLHPRGRRPRRRGAEAAARRGAVSRIVRMYRAIARTHAVRTSPEPDEWCGAAGGADGAHRRDVADAPAMDPNGKIVCSVKGLACKPA
jgi:hypothetical protein